MLRLAYFSPMPPQQTGIADYSADLLPHLASLAEVTLFVDSSILHLATKPANAVVSNMEDYQSHRWNYDMAIYQIGNSLYHEAIYSAAVSAPGITVLHDYTLHHFVASMTAGRGDFPAYLREMSYEQGIQGASEAWEIKEGAPTRLYEVPLTARLIDGSLGTITHSSYAKHLMEIRHPSSRITKIHQPIPLPPFRQKSDLRFELGIPQDAFVVITCGADTPERRLDLVLSALDAYRETHTNVIWLKTGLPSALKGQPPTVTIPQAWIREIGYVSELRKLNDLHDGE